MIIGALAKAVVGQVAVGVQLDLPVALSSPVSVNGSVVPPLTKPGEEAARAQPAALPRWSLTRLVKLNPPPMAEPVGVNGPPVTVTAAGLLRVNEPAVTVRSTVIVQVAGVPVTEANAVPSHAAAKIGLLVKPNMDTASILANTKLADHLERAILR
jgi:hypothetical protein